MPDPEIELLACRCLAGEAGPGERSSLHGRLAADPGLRDWYMEQAAISARLSPGPGPGAVADAAMRRAGSGAGATAAAAWSRGIRRRRMRRIRLAGALAATLAAVLVAGWAMLPARSGHAWTAEGASAITAMDGSPADRPVPGSTIRFADGPGALRFGDGSRMDVVAGSELRIGDHPDPQGAGLPAVHLVHGRLSVAAAPQAIGRRLVVSGPHLSAMVVGTRFRLVAGTDGDRVDVDEGAVQVADRSGRRVLVHAGGQAVTDQAGLIGDDPGDAAALRRFALQPWAQGIPPAGEQLLRMGDFSRWPRVDRVMRRHELVSQTGTWPAGWSANLWMEGASGRFRSEAVPIAGGQGLLLEGLVGGGLQVYAASMRRVPAGATVAVTVVYARDARIETGLDIRVVDQGARSRSITLPGEIGGWMRWDGWFVMPAPGGRPQVFIQHRGGPGRLWLGSVAMSVVGGAPAGDGPGF